MAWNTHWTAKRKTQVVLDILKGKTTVAEVSRQHDLTPGEIERWVDEGSLLRHMRSRDFRAILAVVELSAKSPDLRFDWITGTRGLDYIEETLNTAYEREVNQ